VADRKPPRLTDGERETLHALLQYQREETARHAGRADVLQELIDGDTGR
jgi:hypothetical protein